MAEKEKNKNLEKNLEETRQIQLENIEMSSSRYINNGFIMQKYKFNKYYLHLQFEF